MTYAGYWAQRRIGRRRALGTLAAAGVGAGLLAAGCGDDDDDDGGAPAPTEQAARQPKRGGHLAWAHTSGEQPSQDPHASAAASITAFGTGVAYSRLVRKKVGPDVGTIAAIPEGDLAESWEQPDDTTYILKMRPNVKWHNLPPVNGRAFVAEDAVYSMRRQLDLRFAAASLPPMAGFSAVDAQTLRMEARSPDADFLTTLTATFNVIVPREAVESRGGDLKEGPTIGTGAWMLKEWVRNNVVRLVRNPDYFRRDEFGTQLPYADSLDILRITDVSTRQAAFRSGQILHDTFDKDIALQLKRENPQYQHLVLKYAGGTFCDFMIVRTDQPPTNDIRVRRAINMAIDRETIKETLYFGEGWKAGGMLNASSEDQLLTDDEIDRMVPYDVAGAKRLLQEAGFTGWNPRITAFHTNTSLAEFMQSNMREIDINGSIDIIDNVQLNTWFVQHNREFFPFIRGPQAAGVNADLRTGYATGGTFNPSKMSVPEIDRLIEDQAKELRDTQRRNQMLKDIQRKVIEYWGVVPINGSFRNVIVQPYVRNLFHSYPTSSEPGAYELIWLDQ